MTPLVAVPLNPYVGLEVVADGVAWDPLTAGGTTPYRVICTSTSPLTWRSGTSPTASEIRALNGILVSISTKTADYTVTLADNAKYFIFTAATDMTITLPNTLPAGWSAMFKQGGAGRLIFVAASGGSLASFGGYTKTAGIQATASIIIEANAGTAAQACLSGNLAA